MTAITAIATVALAILAIFTTFYARKAFRAQAKEVSDQATMLRVQSEQLEEQRTINAKQAEVLELQARELQESLDERKQAREQQRRAQASRIFIWHKPGPVLSTTPASAARGATGGRSKVAYLVNSSEQPIYDVMISWHLGNESAGECYLKPLMPGAQRRV
jgi:hypothetical protein